MDRSVTYSVNINGPIFWVCSYNQPTYAPASRTMAFTSQCSSATTSFSSFSNEYYQILIATHLPTPKGWVGLSTMSVNNLLKVIIRQRSWWDSNPLHLSHWSEMLWHLEAIQGHAFRDHEKPTMDWILLYNNLAPFQKYCMFLRSWTHPYSTLILRVAPLYQIAHMLGSARAEALSYSAVKLFSKNSNLCDHEGAEWDSSSKNMQFLANKSPYPRNGARVTMAD